VYTNNEQRGYAQDIEIILQNTILFNQWTMSSDKNATQFERINQLVNFFSSFKQWDDQYDFLNYLLYYESKYLYAFLTINHPNYSKINYLITMYIEYQYNTEIIYEEEPFIQSLTIRANGTDLFSSRDWLYFNSAVPVNKFKNSLPAGFYTYTFSLFPRDEQHSGHLNFTNFDDIVLKLESNPLIVSGEGGPYPYTLSTIIREYNILRVMSGLGSMAWIN